MAPSRSRTYRRKWQLRWNRKQRRKRCCLVCAHTNDRWPKNHCSTCAIRRTVGQHDSHVNLSRGHYPRTREPQHIAHVRLWKWLESTKSRRQQHDAHVRLFRSGRSHRYYFDAHVRAWRSAVRIDLIKSGICIKCGAPDARKWRAGRNGSLRQICYVCRPPVRAGCSLCGQLGHRSTSIKYHDDGIELDLTGMAQWVKKASRSARRAAQR